MAEPTEPAPLAALVPSVVVLPPVVAVLAVERSGIDRVIPDAVAAQLSDLAFTRGTEQ